MFNLIFKFQLGRFRAEGRVRGVGGYAAVGRVLRPLPRATAIRLQRRKRKLALIYNNNNKSQTVTVAFEGQTA